MCGADVRGAGTDVIKVRGVERMHGCTYSIIPDQIEAGSYMVAAAATAGDVLVKNVTPKHLEPITAKLRRAGSRWRNLTMLCGSAAPATSCPSRSTPCPTRASPPICSP
jgi:murA: UDP-N-acetylglucosamine 1-carboxyvinyltransferase